MIGKIIVFLLITCVGVGLRYWGSWFWKNKDPIVPHNERRIAVILTAVGTIIALYGASELIVAGEAALIWIPFGLIFASAFIFGWRKKCPD